MNGEDVGIADGEPGLVGVHQLVGHRGEFFLIQRKTGALEERADLSLEGTHRPISPQALDLIEGALEGIVEGDELLKVGIGKTGEEGIARRFQ